MSLTIHQPKLQWYIYSGESVLNETQKLCVATVTHNVKWVIFLNHICIILDQTLENADVKTLISFG